MPRTPDDPTPSWFRKPSWVYLLYDKKSRLLYIGSTVNLKTRRAEHRRNAPWWMEVERWKLKGPFKNRPKAYAMERTLIHTLLPLYNQPPGGLCPDCRQARYPSQRRA